MHEVKYWNDINAKYGYECINGFDCIFVDNDYNFFTTNKDGKSIKVNFIPIFDETQDEWWCIDVAPTSITFKLKNNKFINESMRGSFFGGVMRHEQYEY